MVTFLAIVERRHHQEPNVRTDDLIPSSTAVGRLWDHGTGSVLETAGAFSFSYLNRPVVQYLPNLHFTPFSTYK